MTSARSRSAPFAHPATAELREAVAWIVRDNPSAARALRVAALGAARLIGAYPEAGPLRRDLTSGPFRPLPRRGFPYVLVHETEPAPRILRVLHGARDLPDLLAGLRD